MSKEHRWTAPTPLRQTRPAAEVAQEPAAVEAPRPASGAPVRSRLRMLGADARVEPPLVADDAPRVGRRRLSPWAAPATLSPEDLAKVQAESAAKVVRPAPRRLHPRAREHEAAVRQDQAGEPCSCGTTMGTACALHGALYGHRRHHRP